MLSHSSQLRAAGPSSIEVDKFISSLAQGTGVSVRLRSLVSTRILIMQEAQEPCVVGLLRVWEGERGWRERTRRGEHLLPRTANQAIQILLNSSSFFATRCADRHHSTRPLRPPPRCDSAFPSPGSSAVARPAEPRRAGPSQSPFAMVYHDSGSRHYSPPRADADGEPVSAAESRCLDLQARERAYHALCGAI